MYLVNDETLKFLDWFEGIEDGQNYVVRSCVNATEGA